MRIIALRPVRLSLNAESRLLRFSETPPRSVPEASSPADARGTEIDARLKFHLDQLDPELRKQVKEDQSRVKELSGLPDAALFQRIIFAEVSIRDREGRMSGEPPARPRNSIALMREQKELAESYILLRDLRKVALERWKSPNDVNKLKQIASTRSKLASLRRDVGGGLYGARDGQMDRISKAEDDAASGFINEIDKAVNNVKGK